MIFTKPHYIFTIFSLLVGLVLVFLTPVMENNDESQHLRRVSEISEFVWLHPDAHTEDPLSLWADSAWWLRLNNAADNKQWRIEDIKNITTEKPERTQLGDSKINVYALYSPLLYLPLGLVLKLAKLIFNPELWVQFYIVRITALLLSVALFATAIAKIPEHKALLACLCLLPAMLYNRSGVNIDGIVIGCSFHFLIKLYNLCRKDTLITISEIAILAFWGFLMAQGKGAYVPLLFSVFLLPKKNWWQLIIVVLIPALLFGLGWSAFAKNTLLKDLHYQTIVGDAWPDGQFAWILSQPFAFAEVLIRTVFTTPLVPQTIMDMMGRIGWNLAYIPPVFLLIFVMMIFLMTLYEPIKKPIYLSIKSRLFLLFLAILSITMALTMLYVQWTGYQQPLIEGFQGRYIYPLLPIFVIFAKPAKEFVSQKKTIFVLWGFASLSSVVTLYYTYHIYSLVHIVK